MKQRKRSPSETLVNANQPQERRRHSYDLHLPGHDLHLPGHRNVTHRLHSHLHLQQAPSESTSSDTWDEIYSRTSGDAQTLVVRVVEAVDIVPHHTFRHADPFVRISQGGYQHQTTVKKHTLSPVWKEQLVFVAEEGGVLTVELMDAHPLHSTHTSLGSGEVSLTAELLESLGDAPQVIWVDVQRDGSPSGRVHLRMWINQLLINEVSVITHEFRNISPSDGSKVVHFLEPNLRHLRVRLKESVVPYFAAIGQPDPFMSVRCGLFCANTEPQLATHHPQWDETFVVPVPYRTAGTNPLPKELQYSHVELLLNQWDNVTGRSLIARVEIPFEEIAGFDGQVIDPHNPPWKTYTMNIAHREGLRRAVYEVGQFVHDHGRHPEGLDKATVTAALHFDTSYYPKPRSSCGTCIVKLEAISLKKEWQTMYVVVKCARHWARFSIPGSGMINKAFQVDVSEPRILFTAAVMASEWTGLRRFEVLGVVHLRPSELVPRQWSTTQFPLITRGRGRCFQNGTLTVSAKWEVPSLSVLFHSYTRPEMPSRYYQCPWTADQSSLFNQFATEAIKVYLQQQEDPVPPAVVTCVLAHEYAKFEMALVKGQFRRARMAAEKISSVAHTLMSLKDWERPWLSLLANAVWCLFAFFPREVTTTITSLVMLRIIYVNVATTARQRMLPMDPEPFGGLADEDQQDADDEEEVEEESKEDRGDESHTKKFTPKVYNPISVLQQKIEHFETSGSKFQFVTQKGASVLESMISAFEFTDFVLSSFLFVALGAFLIALWLLPFSVLLAGAGLYVLRHPHFRRSKPSRGVCLLTRLPNRMDTVIFAKRGIH